jgi:hypothetical protein
MEGRIPNFMRKKFPFFTKRKYQTPHGMGGQFSMTNSATCPNSHDVKVTNLMPYWLRMELLRLPYHRIIEMTLWLDETENVSEEIIKTMEEGVNDVYVTLSNY